MNIVRVELLGFNCGACRRSYQRLQTLQQQMDVSFELHKVDDPQRFLQLQVLKPPGIAINGILRHQGGVPSESQLRQWIIQASDFSQGLYADRFGVPC